MPWLILSFACQLLKNKNKNGETQLDALQHVTTLEIVLGIWTGFELSTQVIISFYSKEILPVYAKDWLISFIASQIFCIVVKHFSVKSEIPKRQFWSFKWTVTEFFLIASKIPRGTMCSNVVTIRLSNSLPNRIWILGSDKWDFNWVLRVSWISR